MDFLQQLKERAKMVEDAFEQYIPRESAYPSAIHRAMRYSLLAGGKRLRPALVLGAAEAVGCDPRRVMPTACALELIHTYSLIHDDLPAMDNDELRRGKPTNHVVFGEAMAILAGDALLTMAFQLMAENSRTAPAEAVVQVIREVARLSGSQGLIGGQVMDTVSADNEVDSETLEYIHRHKTGALFRAAVRSGAILGGAGEKQLRALTGYAENLGLAFQIVDDILDVEGDTAKIGKPVGSDEKNKKATYPALFGIEAARQKARQAADNAIKALSIFGPEVEFLRAAVHFIINRDH
ncbi:geranylgeranyl diphosphate synthase type II [Desulfohalotomaculum tongense]|uniref:farnesyl diphosphate synthase n=1 Tax=Desulforadius tongensis TaxID=1216062 RepID=UPI0019593F7E|nr:geranylgeranyl diphosphate synthase type II [Desulforadius tongensis]